MNNEVRFMKTPYESLKQKYNNRSKNYLMLSELIDNSIGSWNENKMKTDLDVFVEINIPDKKIVCTDNAFGMNEQELLDSVELNKEKIGNNINMFGVGMKNAAFWFGQDLIIKTNNGISASSTSVRLSKVRDFNEPVQWKIENNGVSKKEQGTQVLIENVYEARVMTEDEAKEAAEIIQTKYRKYLIGTKRGKVNIVFSVIPKKGEPKEIRLHANPIKAQVIPADFVDKFIENLESNFANPEVVFSGLIEQAKNKALEGEPLSFEFPVNFKGDTIVFEMGITRQSKEAGGDREFFKTNFGVTAYQKDRAIRMSPLNPIDFPKQDYTRTDIKRVYGFCELGHIFRPDNNKSDFNFGINRTAFDNLMTNIGKDMIRLATAVANTIGVIPKVKVGTSKSSRAKLEKALDAKSNKFNWDKFKTTDTEMSFKDRKGKEWKVVLTEVAVDDPEDNNYFINSDISKKDQFQINIKFNVNHPIWKPLVNDANTIDLKTVTYPLVTLMGLSKVGIENNLMFNWLGTETDDYLEVISQLAKFGLKV